MNELTLVAIAAITLISQLTPSTTTTAQSGGGFKGSLELSKEFEGAETQAYRLPGEDEYTVGYGLKGFYFDLDGNKIQVTQGTTLSEEELDLTKEIRFELEFLPELQKIPYWDEMTAEQQTALASFAWNLGANFYGSEGFSTITSALADKRWEDVPEAFLLYTRSASEGNREGLLRRREAEAKMWKKGLLSSQSEV